MIPIARKLIIIVDQLGFLVNMEDPSRFLVPPDDLTTLPNENNSLNADEVEKAQNVLTWLERELITDLNLKQSQKKLNTIKRKLSEDGLIPIREYKRDISELQNLIDFELADIVFGYIPAEKASYFKNPYLFGEEVCKNFPSARDDIKAAGTCYAHENYTATVFHLMRAVEIGVKVMVNTMRAQKHLVTTTHGGKRVTKKPVELCDWKTLIDGLKKALTALEAGSKTSVKKKETLAYYSHAIAQFGYFKDAWRNNISHGNNVAPNRKFYLEGETTDIMNSAKLFMQHLAKRIKE